MSILSLVSPAKTQPLLLLKTVMEFATESVNGVRFGLMSDEEAGRLSFKKITSSLFLDPVGSPVSGGLYDSALGPIDEGTNCKSCGQRYFNCPGHFGHIDLVSVVYNPLLFDALVKILRATCFSCFHFKQEVKICLMKLKLIVKGDISGAKTLVLGSKQDIDLLHPSMSDLSEDNIGNPYSGGDCKLSERSDKQEWSSLQINEARSVLDKFLKGEKKKECDNCGKKSPKLDKRTFGWIRLVHGMKFVKDFRKQLSQIMQ